jgi:hypothetical protein
MTAPLVNIVKHPGFIAAVIAYYFRGTVLWLTRPLFYYAGMFSICGYLALIFLQGQYSNAQQV